MELSLKARRAGSRGMGKASIVFLVLVFAGAIFVLANFGPVFQQKWDFEQRMGEDLNRLYTLQPEGIMTDLNTFVENHKIPCQPPKDCKIMGEPGKPGKMTCDYTVPMDFTVLKEPYQFKVHALAKRARIALATD